MSEVDKHLTLLSGKDFFIDNLIIPQKKLKDVQEYGYENYLWAVQGLLLEKETLQQSLDDRKIEIIETQAMELGKNTTFDYYIKYTGEETLTLLARGLSFVFNTKDIIMEDDHLLVNSTTESEEGLKIISRDNFDFLVQAIKLQNNFPVEAKEEEKPNPKDERARQLIAQMKENQRKIDELKKNSGESKENIFPFNDIVSAVTTKSNSINKFNVWDLTIYQLYDEFNRINAIDNYNINIEAMMNGAKIEDLKHWASKG